MLTLCSLPAAAFLVASPAPTVRSAARTASATHLLDGKYRSPPSLLVAFPQSREQKGQRGQGASPLQFLLRLLGWSLSCSSAEDVMLALVAPETFRLCVQWRRTVFGSEQVISKALTTAREQIVVAADPAHVHSVSIRRKGVWSTFHKACMRGQRVHDVLALRVVVRGEENACFHGMDVVRRLWPTLPGRSKDYVNLPKQNGYQALHDTVLLPCGVPMEVQIRTQQMHRHAEHGLASHRRYKGRAHELPSKLLADLSSLGSLPIPEVWRSPLLGVSA